MLFFCLGLPKYQSGSSLAGVRQLIASKAKESVTGSRWELGVQVSACTSSWLLLAIHPVLLSENRQHADTQGWGQLL